MPQKTIEQLLKEIEEKASQQTPPPVIKTEPIKLRQEPFYRRRLFKYSSLALTGLAALIITVYSLKSKSEENIPIKNPVTVSLTKKPSQLPNETQNNELYQPMLDQLVSRWALVKDKPLYSLADFRSILECNVYSEAIKQYQTKNNIEDANVQKIDNEIEAKALRTLPIVIQDYWEIETYKYVAAMEKSKWSPSAVSKNSGYVLRLYKHIFDTINNSTHSNLTISGNLYQISDDILLKQLAVRLLEVGTRGYNEYGCDEEIVRYIENKTGWYFPNFREKISAPVIKSSPQTDESYDWGNHFWRSPEEAREWNLHPHKKGDRPAR